MCFLHFEIALVPEQIMGEEVAVAVEEWGHFDRRNPLL